MKLGQLLIGLTFNIAVFGVCYFNATGYNLEKIDYSYTPNAKEKSQIPPLFRYESFSRGITTPHFHSGSHISSIADSLGAGACAFDANNDGYIDILTLNGPGRVRDYGKKSWWTDHPATSLYINDGDGFFEEFQIFGIDSGTPTMGCSIDDFNADGWQDIIITSQENNYLALNNNGEFLATVLPGGNKFSTSAASLDYNQDQRPDIYISNYIRFQRHQNTLETNAGFLSKTDFSSSKFQGENNTLLLNLGNGNFKEIADPLLTSDQSRTLYSLIIDINNDAQVDFILANDKGSKNRVFLSSKNASDNLIYTEPDSHYLAQKNSTRSISAIMNKQPQFILSMPIGNYNPTLSKNNNSYDSLESSRFSTWGSLVSQQDPFRVIYINGLKKASIHNKNITTSQKNLLVDKEIEKTTNLPGLFASDSSRSGLQIDIDNDGDLDLLITNNNGYPALLVNYSEAKEKSKEESTFLGMTKGKENDPSKKSKSTPNRLNTIFHSSNYSTNVNIMQEKSGVLRSAMFNKLINSSYNNSTGKINHPKNLDEREILMLLSFELSTRKYLSCTSAKYIKKSFITEELLVRYKNSFTPLLLENINEDNENLNCILDAISYSRSRYAYDEIMNKINKSDNQPYISSLKSAALSLPIGDVL